MKFPQLKAACDEPLMRRVQDGGGLPNIDTEEALLAEMKKLAVRVVHKTLHLLNIFTGIIGKEV